MMIRFLSAIALLVMLAACNPPGSNTSPDPATAPATSTAKPQVYVANYPLQYFATRLAGDVVDVHFPATAGEDPAFWQPDDATIARYQAADLILMNGASYSKWVETTTLPDEKVVSTSSSFSDRFIEIEDAITHSHGPGGEHSHSGTAFTTWLDFSQAIQQARAVAQAIEPLVPKDKAGSIRKHLDELTAELQSLDNRLLNLGKLLQGKALVASHPVYQYLARRYQLDLHAVHWEPETVPDDKAMEELRALLQKHPTQWMIWEDTPAPESVQKLQVLQVRSLVFNPCGKAPQQGAFMTVMKANVKALEDTLQH